jgi:hypothetical protein
MGRPYYTLADNIFAGLPYLPRFPPLNGDFTMLPRMKTIVVGLFCGLVALTARAESAAPTAVVCAKDGPSAERLAGKEVRRYVYLRTGKLLPIVDDLKAAPQGGVIMVGRGAIRASGLQPVGLLGDLKAEQFTLKTIQHDGRPVLLIAGGDAAGTLYGAYRFAEHLGVRFYMQGDVAPDKQIALELPTLDETRKPLFELRGIQPFHDFPEGPDWWSRDGYKAILGQLPKMGMNFIGLHTYPDSKEGPEPLVWIGPPSEMAPDGKVKASYPSRHFTTDNVTGACWGYPPCRTSDYAFGAAEMFDRDDYGTDYMRDTHPWNKMSPEQCNALMDRMGQFLSDVFTFARHMGIKTCLGTETPLTVPAAVKQRLQAAGKNPADPAVVQEVYEGMFQRIAKTHPLDYYWFWTPEDWRGPVKQQTIDATVADFRAAIAAAEKVKPPFTLATCGWVLGPLQNPSLFDRFLPKQMPMSCIVRELGTLPVERGFAKITGRPKWAIPWMEDDPGMTMPQLWAGRMRRDAVDALKYGCTGLMGIHWRTRILGPNVSALAKAAWDQTGWTGQPKAAVDLACHVIAAAGDKSQYLPVDDFYADWVRTEFGPEAAGPIAAIFSQLDGRLPRPADWVTGPGSIRPNGNAWEQVQKEYVFVDELAALRPRIEGPGNLERFDYWLNNFRYLRSIAKVRCDWGRFNAALAKVKAEKDGPTQKKLARELALPARKELVAAFAEMHRHLLATVTNPGEMGNVCNWQQQTLPVLITAPGQELAKLLGEPLPADAIPSKQYQGGPRLFVPEVRTGILAGETLRLTVIVLGAKPQAAELHWRPLGAAVFAKVPLTHVARGVYTVALPAEAVSTDFEYYVRAEADGKSLVFPPTAPALNQTVVVAE